MQTMISTRKISIKWDLNNFFKEGIYIAYVINLFCMGVATVGCECALVLHVLSHL